MARQLFNGLIGTSRSALVSSAAFPCEPMMHEPEPEKTASVPTRSPAVVPNAPPRADGGSERVHDFAAKLQQPSLWDSVVDYVAWSRALRAAAADGRERPPIPDRAPPSINLDLTTACNYACDHCIDWDILNSKVRHADDDLRASLREMAARGLKSVILIGGGEPTLYPGFVSFVVFLKELGLHVAVVSNGSKNEKILEIAPHLGPQDWVRLSLDAGSNETFRRMHKPSRASLTLDEICSYVPKIKAANPRFAMGFSYVITWRGGTRDDVHVVENIHEMVDAAQRARDAGFDYISYKPFLERSGEGAEVLDPRKAEQALDVVRARMRALLDEARRLERPGFRVLASTNLRVLLSGEWTETSAQPRTCHMQFLRQVLTPNGLYNCPAHRGVEKARIADKDAYADAERTRRTQAATADILARFDASHECREVTCLYHSTNWWLERMIESGDIPAKAPGTEGEDWFL